MRKLQNRIEKKEHGFIVNVMANKEITASVSHPSSILI